MNRSELKEKASIVTDKIDAQLAGNAHRLLIIVAAGAYFAGTIWPVTLPLLFIAAIVCGVLWMLADDGDSSGSSDSKKSKDSKSGPLDAQLNGSSKKKKDKSGSEARQ